MNTPPPQAVEPPRKKGCLKAALITLGIGFVLFVSLFILMIVLANRETKALKEAAAPFFAKIQANEIQAAYAMASPSYRESVKLEDLESFVSETNLAGFTNADWRYASAETAGESAIEGSVTTAEGAIVPILVTLVEEGDGFAVSGISKKEKETDAGEKEESTATVIPPKKKETKEKVLGWSWSTARLENIRIETTPKADTDPPVFSADIPELKIVADLRSAPSNTEITAAWVLVESADGKVKDLEVVRTSFIGESGREAIFLITRTDPVMAAGSYLVKLYINSKLKAEIPFLIELDFPSLIARAEEGDAEAQLGVGLAHRHEINGYTGALNEPESVKWLEKSAQQGDRRAQFYLSEMYMLGRGVPPDSATAVSWLEKSAGQGFAKAQRVIGLAYIEGLGVEQDLDRAATWLEKASNQGDVTATTRLGELLLNHGTDEQKAKGAKLIQSAAEDEFADAQFVLGQMHEMGLVVEANPAKAREYFEAAAANGSPDAVKALKRLDGKPEE